MHGGPRSMGLQAVLSRLPVLAFSGRTALRLHDLKRALDVRDRHQDVRDRRDTERDRTLEALGDDIREAAASVTALSRILLEETACEPLGPRQSRAVQAILAASARIDGLGRDLDVLTARPAERPQRLDPAHVLVAAARRRRLRAGESAQFILPLLTPGLGVLAEAGALDDLLDRLFDEAARLAGTDGAVAVEVHQAGDVRIVLQTSGTGPSMEGFGDGLSPGRDLNRAWRLAERLGGAVTVETGAHVGPRIILRLPGVEGRPLHARPLPAPLPPGMRMLAVGVQGPERALLKLLGGALGLNIHMADGAGTGIDLVRALAPDVVLMDAVLSAHEAALFAGAMSEDPELCRIGRVAVLPAAPAVGQVRQLREQGFRHILARPLDIRDLAFALHALVARSHAARERPSGLSA